jgi:general secretion pathway protein K
MNHDSRESRRQRGFALLIVLWSLALLAMLGTAAMQTASRETQLMRNLGDAALLETAADGAVEHAIYASLDTTSGHWAADGVTRSILVGRVPVRVNVQDEADKINPNFASTALLQSVLIQLRVDPVTALRVASAITDWRDAGGTPGHPSAVNARYAAAGLDYAPSGERFTSIDDLAAVLGMTPELLAALRPHLTVFSNGDPSLATSDPVVASALIALGQDDTASSSDPSGVICVTAEASITGLGQFAVRVVARINDRGDGRPYRVLASERLWGGMP